MPAPHNSDCLVIGGGVIGLSIAYELSGEGLSVTLLERGEPGREASWAGAGILPPASWYGEHPALEEMASLSRRLHEDWSHGLREETGIDNQYWRCGCLYLGDDESFASTRQTLDRWSDIGVRVEAVEPRSGFRAAWLVPDEAQVRNPRHLAALESACRDRGVRLVNHAPAESFRRCGDDLVSVATPRGEYSAGDYVLAAGCWTPALAGLAGVEQPGRPIRGQMLLLQAGAAEAVPERIVHAPPYYLVPRRDGRVLVGATVEDVGFDKQTTDSAREELCSAMLRVAPGLASCKIERHWSGLRPHGGGELPRIGRMPGLSNAWVATGHHRAGLQFSPATARLIGALVRGESSPIDPSPFAPRPRASAVAG